MKTEKGLLCLFFERHGTRNKNCLTCITGKVIEESFLAVAFQVTLILCAGLIPGIEGTKFRGWWRMWKTVLGVVGTREYLCLLEKKIFFFFHASLFLTGAPEYSFYSLSLQKYLSTALVMSIVVWVGRGKINFPRNFRAIVSLPFQWSPLRLDFTWLGVCTTLWETGCSSNEWQLSDFLCMVWDLLI